MTTVRLSLLAAAIAFAATLAVLALTGDESDPGRATAAAEATPDPGSVDGQIAAREAAVKAKPRDVDGYVLLAMSYLDKVTETADASYYERAEETLDRALAIEPNNAAALTERGALRMNRHDFKNGLADGRRAHELAPAAVRPFGVMVDGLVELGRYGPAERTLQRMINLKPDLASYARVSYQRELRGDVRGALQAMRLARTAAGPIADDAAYTSSLIGELLFDSGRYEAARKAFADALDQVPGYGSAVVGTARVDAATGNLDKAIATLREELGPRPTSGDATILAEMELAAGNREEADEAFALVEAADEREARYGVILNVELALYEAEHGNPERAVRLARKGWRQSPNVRAADSLSWSLTRAGRAREGLKWVPRALALGTRSPAVLYRSGMTARAAGDREQAKQLLRRALDASPNFSPLFAPRARAALKSL